MTLYDEYKNVLNEHEKWNPTRKTNIEHDIEKVFIYPCSYNFIFELLWGDSDVRSLVPDFNKLSNKIPHNRFDHTISLYLYGILVADIIGYDKFKLPIWDEDERRNFLHHWLPVCLFHDVGYAIEDHYRAEKLSDIKTIDKLSEKLGLKYRLDNECDAELLSSYYKYRINEHNKADHGIVSAMVLYDSLMVSQEKKKNIAKTAFVVSEKPIIGTHIENAIAIFAQSIARHNMWYATDDNKDIYRKYGLNELIVSEEKSTKIFFGNNPMLFLLCFIDSIEPVKAYNMNPVDALKGVKIILDKDENKVSLQVVEGQTGLAKSIKGLTDWMSVMVDENHTCISFDIMKAIP